MHNAARSASADLQICFILSNKFQVPVAHGSAWARRPAISPAPPARRDAPAFVPSHDVVREQRQVPLLALATIIGQAPIIVQRLRQLLRLRGETVELLRADGVNCRR
jgi:hypothetical protein